MLMISVDLLSGINVGTISHESKIDWLEVSIFSKFDCLEMCMYREGILV